MKIILQQGPQLECLLFLMADKFQFIENSQHSDCLVTKVNYPWLHFSFD